MKKTQADKPLPSARSLRALILEDNPQNVERASRWGFGEGHSTVEAGPCRQEEMNHASFRPN